MRGGMRGRGVRLVGWMVGLQLLAGCQVGPTRLEVPVSGWPAFEYFYLAEKSGLDRPEGLAIHSVQLPDPQAVMNAFARGQFEVAQLSAAEVIDLCNRVPSRCPVVVLVLDESRGGDQVAVRPGIASLADLRGRRVGLTLSTLGPYVLSRALEREGLSLDDVQVRNMPLEGMGDALARGTVDAVAFFPPYSELAYRDGVVRKLFDSRAIPGEIFDVLVVSPEFYATQGAVLARLLRTWQAAHELAKAEPAMARALMAQREGLTADEFRSAEEGLVYWSLRQQEPMLAPGGTLERNLLAVQEVQKALKLVESDSPLPRVSQAPLQAALR